MPGANLVFRDTMISKMIHRPYSYRVYIPGRQKGNHCVCAHTENQLNSVEGIMFYRDDKDLIWGLAAKTGMCRI